LRIRSGAVRQYFETPGCVWPPKTPFGFDLPLESIDPELLAVELTLELFQILLAFGDLTVEILHGYVRGIESSPRFQVSGAYSCSKFWSSVHFFPGPEQSFGLFVLHIFKLHGSFARLVSAEGEINLFTLSKERMKLEMSVEAAPFYR